MWDLEVHSHLREQTQPHWALQCGLGPRRSLWLPQLRLLHHILGVMMLSS